MHLCRVQLCCNHIFHSLSVQTLHILVTESDQFEQHDFQSVPSSLKEFQIQSLTNFLCSNSLSECCRLQMSVFVSELVTTLYMERTCADRVQGEERFFSCHSWNPQQNLPKSFCSESWKLSIVENWRKMLRYAQEITIAHYDFMK